MWIWSWYEFCSCGYVFFPITLARFRRFWTHYMAKNSRDVYFFFALFLGFILFIWNTNENIRSQFDHIENQNMKLCKETIPSLSSSFSKEHQHQIQSLESEMEWLSIRIAHKSCEELLTSWFWVPLAYSVLKIGNYFSILLLTICWIELFYSRKSSTSAFLRWLHSRVNNFSILSFFFFLYFSGLIIYWSPTRISDKALIDEVLDGCQRVIQQIVISNHLVHFQPLNWCRERFGGVFVSRRNFIPILYVSIFAWIAVGAVVMGRAFERGFTNLNNYLLWRIHLEENAWIQNNLINGFMHPDSPQGDSKNVAIIITEYLE